MGIYSNWDEFVKMAKESAGTAGAELPPPARWRDNVHSYLDACKIFIEFCILLCLIIVNFYLWLDVILIGVTK